ncbi:MAG: G8 domain-containing protein, partial [Ferruginibacter sp.]
MKTTSLDLLKKSLVLLSTIMITLLFSANVNAQITSAIDGPWSDPNTWDPMMVPGPGDNVIIDNNTLVTIDVNNASCASLQIGGAYAGALSFNTSSVLTVSGSFTIGGGSDPSQAGALTFTDGSGNTNGYLKVGGAFVITKLATFNRGVGTIEFNKSGAQTVPANSALGPYYNLTLSGSGIKATTAVQVYGVITMAGSATASGA